MEGKWKIASASPLPHKQGRRTKTVLTGETKGMVETAVTEKTTVSSESGLGGVFDARSWDSDIRRLILRRLSLPDLQSLSVVSHNARGFAMHRQALSKWKAAEAGICKADVGHALFPQLWATLHGGHRSTTLRPLFNTHFSDYDRKFMDTMMRMQLIQYPYSDYYKTSPHVLAVNRQDQGYWLVFSSFGDLVHSWPLSVSLEGLRFYFYYPYSGLSAGEEHWLAVLVCDDKSLCPTPHSLHILRNGRQLHRLSFSFPFANHSFPFSFASVQLCAAWDRVYLAVASHSHQSPIQLYSLSAESAPRRLLSLELSSTALFLAAEPFTQYVTNSELKLSCLMRGPGFCSVSFLHSLVLGRGSEKVRTETEPLSLPGLEAFGRETNAVILGRGARFLAMALEPPMRRSWGDHEPREAKLVLLERAGGSWSARRSFPLPCPDPWLTASDGAPNTKWLCPSMLEEGLRVEHFQSGQPWLYIDKMVFGAPLLH